MRGDLECILLKSLEKDREKRYQSAADLARDLRSYLNGEPTDARPPTVFNRVLRLAARYPKRITAMLSFAIAAMIFGGTALSFEFLKRRPYKIWRSDDGREAQLLSISGRILGQWTSEVPGGIKFAELSIPRTSASVSALTVSCCMPLQSSLWLQPLLDTDE